ncbi:MAG: cysteine desulfurase [Deltaproteobacteria bacterium]|nr:cysteine desulfurase [Deltaproteobacteria bacterium]
MRVVSDAYSPDTLQELRGRFDVDKIREDFPILDQQIHGKRLVYLDNAASTQKPRAVIDAETLFMARDYANIHRGVHELSQRATEAYESVRGRVRRFINAEHDRQIVFVRGTTEGINLVAHGIGKTILGPGDEILITHMEHHSNIVPWQMVCEERGAKLRVAPINEAGELDLAELEKLITERTRLVALVHVSNALGTINPVEEIIRFAHEKGVPVLLDGAQAVAHAKVDVRALGADFYVFSSHKLYGPTGVGVLYASGDWLDRLPPYQGGGDMISSVSFEKTIYNKPPFKFEAGTPNITGVVGFGAAIDYVEDIGFRTIEAYERLLLNEATERLREVDGVRLIGTAREKAGVLSFVIDGVHPHDVGTILDQDGIAIRAGHHCAQPVMERFGVPATARASFAFYNTREEIDKLVRGVRKVREVFA